MLQYPHLSPIALELGPIIIRWYGLMYLIGFSIAWFLGRRRAARPDSGWTPLEIDDLIAWGIVGLVLGARLGYILFYDPAYFMANPAAMLKIWQGGMSFHGGAIGVTLSMLLFGRVKGKNFFDITDFVVVLAPPGLFFGRIGNFINGELWGRVTDLPWGMIFPDPYAGHLPRHPSQLYEAFLEGLVLFLILWFFSAKPRPRMSTSGLFLLGYGGFRFLVEFARQPDSQLGFIAFNWLTMGQLLCLPMILGGLFLLWLGYRLQAKA